MPLSTLPSLTSWARASSRATVIAMTGLLVLTGLGAESLRAPSNASAASVEQTLFDSTVPQTASVRDTQAVELGVRFTTSTAGQVNGIRFFKGSSNTGTHTGSLWSAGGSRLATATFVNESGSGWQTVKFPAPVSVTPGTTYVASYLAPLGRYAADQNYFASPRSRGALTAPAVQNGVYRYGATGGFPSSSYRSSNYWVDPVFQSATPMPAPSPSGTPAPPAPSPTSSPTASPPTAPAMQTLLGDRVPAVVADPDTLAVELGMRFSTAVNGQVTSVRFYKGVENTGQHTGSLWTAGGQRLTTATFVNETGSGWQTATFPQPVALTAGTTYTVSYYAPAGRYAAEENFFSSALTNGALSAVAGANGVYRYGSGGGFPTDTYQSTNYSVDVVFAPSTGSPSPSPTTPAAPAPSATATPAPSPSPTSPAPALVNYGWGLTPSNTGLAGAGVDRNSLPVYTGTVTSGMTLSRVKITNILDLSNTSNVTLDRVWLAPVGGVRAIWLGAGSVIKDSDVDGSSMVQGERIGIGTSTSGSYQITRTSVTNVSIGTWLDGDGAGTMTETYVRDLVSINGAHKDGFTRRAGIGSLLIDRSRLDASGPMVTGAFFLQNTWGDRIGGITVKDSLFEGAGWVMTLANDGPGTSVSLNNVRVRPYAGSGGTSYGPRAVYGSVQYPVWNNVRLYDGSLLPGAEGTLLAP